MTPKHISDFPPDTRWAQGPGFAIAVTVGDERVYRVDASGVRELVFGEPVREPSHSCPMRPNELTPDGS